MNGYLGGLRTNMQRWNALDGPTAAGTLGEWATSNAAHALRGGIDHEFLHTFQAAWNRFDGFPAGSFHSRLAEWQEATAGWASFSCTSGESFDDALQRVDPASPGINQWLDLNHPDVAASLAEWSDALNQPPGTTAAEKAQRRCVSSEKMADEVPDPADPGRLRGGSRNRIGGFITAATMPEMGPFEGQIYGGGAFWRYVVEQWARYPYDSPRGILQRMPLRASRSIYTPLGDLGRAPDEGVDLLGFALERFSQAHQAGFAGTMLPKLDTLFRDLLGRSLAHLFADYHTALVLKEYQDRESAGATLSRTFINPRWRFDWIGDFNASDIVETEVEDGMPDPAGNAAGLHDRGWSLSGLRGAQRIPRPLPVPSGAARVDANGTERPRRLLDSWSPGVGGGPPTPRFLAPGEAHGDGTPVHLSWGGFAAFAVRTSPAYGAVTIRVTSTSPVRPIVRVFVVDGNGPTLLQPCRGVSRPGGQIGIDPEGCRSDEAGNVIVSVGAPAAANPDREIITIVSGAEHEGRFTWAVSPAGDDGTLTIITPTPLRPAEAGTFSPGATDDRRGVLTQIRALSPTGEPRGPLAGSLTLCVGTGLANSAVDGLLVELPGTPGDGAFEFPPGEFWNAIDLPDAAYALATPATPVVALDLRALWHRCALAPGPNAQPEPPHCLASDYPAHCDVRVATSPASIVVRDPGSQPPASVTMFALDAVEHAGETSFHDLQAIIPPLLATLGDDDYIGANLYAQNSVMLSPAVFPAGAPTGPGPGDNWRSAIAALVEVAGPRDEPLSTGDGMVDAQYGLLAGWPTGPGTGGACTASPGGCLPTTLQHRMVVVAAHNQSASLPARAYLMIDGNEDQIGDDDDHDWPANVKLNYIERLQGGLTVPTIDAISIGPNGAVPDMQRAANTSGGRFFYLDPSLPALGGSADIPRAQTLEDLEFFVNKYDDFQNSDFGDTWGWGPGYGPWIQVESGVRDLRYTLFASEPGARVDETVLVDPAGNPVFPTTSGETWAVYRVSEPLDGNWQVEWLGDPENPPLSQRVHFSQYVRHPVRFSFDARAVHAEATTFGAPPGSERSGDRIVLRASLGSAGSSGWPMIGVDVQRPDGQMDFLYLSDGGYGGDPIAGDGIFQTTYQTTSSPGAYRFLARVMLWSPDWGMIQRHDRVSIYLAPAADGDGDTLPDWWELWRGTNPTQADGDQDPDGDGLYNTQEFALRTDPQSDDTDAGGENDGSEVLQYRDPARREDDVARVEKPIVCTHPSAVRLIVAPVTTSSSLEVRRTLDDGTEVTIHDGLAPPDRVVMDAPPMGERACYRVRDRQPTWFGEAVSAWSAPKCTERSLDPIAPRLDVSLPMGLTSPSRYVDVDLHPTHGTPEPDSDSCAPYLQDLEDAAPADFVVTTTPVQDAEPTLAWAPITAPLSLRLDEWTPTPRRRRKHRVLGHRA